MAIDFKRIQKWLKRHRRTLMWVALLLVTGWIPLAKALLHWHDFKDEVYPVARLYEAEPAEKLSRMLRGEGPPLIFAHRGDHLFYGYNSMEAFERAVERGYDGIELDVINTAEDVPIISHDFKLGPDRDLVVPDSTVAQVQAYAQTLPDTEGARYRTFEEVLDRIGGEILLIVEIKASEKSIYGVAAPVCTILKERGIEDTVILSSLEYAAVETIQDTPECDGVALMYEVSGSGGDPPATYDLPLLGLRHDFLPKRKDRAPASVQAFSVYTPNWVWQIERAMDHGALLIQTDKPGRAMRLRAEQFDW